MRKTIWDFLQNNLPHNPCPQGPGLISLATEIAQGNTTPPPLRGTPGPSAINYLTNAEPPKTTPWGLAGIPGFTSVSLANPPFGQFASWAAAKTALPSLPVVPPAWQDWQDCGFLTGGKAGLSILFGGWSDFCLYCWANYPASNGVRPTLILSKDNDALSGGRVPTPHHDWGTDEARDVLTFWLPARDPSTRNLFSAIAGKASGAGKPITGQTSQFEPYIGSKRLFVFNVWPWFRVDNTSTGKSNSTGNSNIHQFANLPIVHHWLSFLIRVLNPERVLLLGGWGGIIKSRGIEKWLRDILKAASVRQVPPFYHPSYGSWSGTSAQGVGGFMNALP